MPLTTSEVIIRLTEDIETLKNYIQGATDKGFVFPKEIEIDLKDIEHDLEIVRDEDYCDIELMVD